MPKQLIWTTGVGQLLDYPIEIQRLMGSRTLFVMEVHNRQQDSLKAHDITENCFTYGTLYVLWLSHFRNLSIDENHWTINWCLQHLASYIHSRTCSLYPIKKGKHDKIMDSFWQQLYTLISYYSYFCSSYWKIQELFSVSNLWMAISSCSEINIKKWQRNCSLDKQALVIECWVWFFFCKV